MALEHILTPFAFCRFAPTLRYRHRCFIGSNARRFNDFSAESQTRPDGRVRVRSTVKRIRNRHAAIRIRVVVVEIATGDAHTKLLDKIHNLENELREALSRKERAISMAQQTKRGHVYVISNIGLFGENVYKIGMTRRLEPEDRVKELGDASVPFSFDIHAMIFSEDAPKLEAALHNQFESHKVNMVNPRKEFFNVTLDEIKDVVKNNHIDATFIDIPESEEYRETRAILKKLQSQT